MTNQTIWDHFQTVEIGSFRNSLPRMRFLVARLCPGEQVLNVGVGAGFLEELALRKGVDIHALDPSAAAIERLRERLPIGERAVVADVERIPYPIAAFGVVIMSEVLEHLDDRALSQGLAEVRRVLEPAGRFILTVPYEEYLPDGVVFCPGCGNRFHRWGHVRSFNRQSLQETLARHGFRVEKMSLETFPDWRRPGLSNFVKSAVRFLLGRLGSPIAQACLYAEARRA